MMKVIKFLSKLGTSDFLNGIQQLMIEVEAVIASVKKLYALLKA